MEEFELQGTAGQPVNLPISPGPATGYSWRLELPAGVQRIDDGPGPEVAAANRLGGAVAGAIRVLVAAPGSYVLDGQLVRPWDAQEVVRTVRIHLHIS